MIKVWLQETEEFNVENIEGYICDHSFDEEQQKTFFYSSFKGQELFLTQEDISQITQTNFEEITLLIKKQYKNDNSFLIKDYIEQLKHPLLVYAANYFLNTLQQKK